jgi:hypothetical protein
MVRLFAAVSLAALVAAQPIYWWKYAGWFREIFELSFLSELRRPPRALPPLAVLSLARPRRHGRRERGHSPAAVPARVHHCRCVLPRAARRV